jgi:VanZ family protein
LKRVLGASLCTALFFFVGSLPAGPGGSQGSLDKLLHALGFGLLAGLWCSALAELRPRLGVLLAAGGGFAASSAFGGLLELWQGRLGYRSCELLDWIADIVGAFAVAVGWAAWRARGRGPATSA